MVYRYDSDEDAFFQYREGEPEGQSPRNGPPLSGGPSRSRFPTPSLPRPSQMVLPSAAPPAPAVPAPPQGAAPADAAAAPAGAVPPHEPTSPSPAQAPHAPVPPHEPTSLTPAQAPHAPVPPHEPVPPSPAQAPHGPTPPHEPAAPAAVSPAPAAPPPEPVTTAVVPPPRRGGGRAWQVLIGAAAVLVLLALCGLTAATLLDGRQLTNPSAAQPSAAPETTRDTEPVDASNLDSRDIDQAPLTAREVFPSNTLSVGDGQSGYKVLRTQSSGSCAVAATGEVSDLLVRLGCNQVVRGTLRAPDGEHLITAGLFNLTDRSSAERARDQIRQLLDERQGRFRGMSAGSGTEIIATAPARVGWQARGHYIAYAVVARTDGATIRSGDAGVREILYDLLELHLNGDVLDRRANGGFANQPTVASTDRAGNQSASTGN